jgi:hypothetical protein
LVAVKLNEEMRAERRMSKSEKRAWPDTDLKYVTGITGNESAPSL